MLWVLALCLHICACFVHGESTNPTIFAWDFGTGDEQVAAELAELVHNTARHARESASDFMLVVDKPLPLRSAENATFLVLCRNSEVYELLETIQSIQDRYNNKRHHDWVFLNDEIFLDQFVVLVSLFIRYGQISFGQVPKEHWLYPEWVNQTLAAEMRHQLQLKNVVYAESESYRHMCRFYLGFFYKHPLVRQYRYYWRLEPGVRFYCDIDYDVFAFMRENEKAYAFVLSMFEYSDTIPLLWDTAQRHFALQENAPDPTLLDLVRNNDVNGTYNLCHFWLNFEIADLSFFSSPQYEAYFTSLDRSGGFFYERWGDAPVHTLAVANLLDRQQVWWFQDFGYYHLPYLHCPQGPIYARNRCSCDQSMDFTFSHLSCTPHILQVLSEA